MSTSTPHLPRYDAFNIHDFTYKTVRGCPIHLSILVSRDITIGKRPLLVRFHGGGLVEGVRLGDWFRPYILDYCAANSAIIVTPDYRFMPESTGWDILDDLGDVWKWIAEDLSSALGSIKAGLDVDLDHVAVSGESAGGYLAAQSFLIKDLLPNNVGVRAALLQAPTLDLDWYKKPLQKSIFDLPTYPKDTPQRLLESSPSGAVVTNHEPGPGLRLEAAISMFQHGTLVDALEGRLGSKPPVVSEEKRDKLWPLRNLRSLGSAGSGSAKLMPALWVVSGWQDCMVPVEGTFKFCSTYKRLFPDTKVLMEFHDGDHGFDGEWRSDAPEVKRGWDFIKHYW